MRVVGELKLCLIVLRNFEIVEGMLPKRMSNGGMINIVAVCKSQDGLCKFNSKNVARI